MSDWLSDDKMNMIKNRIIEYKYEGKSIKFILACIHDLFQEYIISEDQEMELYYLADPEDKYNDVWDYWNEMNEPNGLMELLR